MFRALAEFEPSVVIIGPITNLISVGNSNEVKSALMRLVNLLKSKLITSMFTSLLESGNDFDQGQVSMSSLMDTWMLLKDVESGGETNRCIKIIKSRGMAHSNQMREFIFTDKGINIINVYTGPGGVLTGSARGAQKAREKEGESTSSRKLPAKSANLNTSRPPLRLELPSCGRLSKVRDRKWKRCSPSMSPGNQPPHKLVSRWRDFVRQISWTGADSNDPA